MSLTASQAVEQQTVTEQVVAAVAAEKDVTELTLAPLYDAIDPDALESLFQAGATGRVRFAYEGYDVTVHTDGEVDVSPRGA
jgi:hypothetical protein